ncbi:MAG: glycosyl transferase family 36 [Eubacteriaceae bacterium]|nr:glycosyl transferase family 36 [Eubacteriaceae bacterium]
MKLKLIPAAHELISNMRTFFQADDSKLSYLNEEPMREELFSSDQMEHFGKTLATRHKLSTKPAKDHLVKRLADNEIILQEVRKLLTDSIKKNNQLTPAGEWLIDNFFMIEEHIQIGKTHFPKNYSEDLPQLVNETSSGITRSYDIAIQIISHNDGRIDIESLGLFVKAYQTITNLKLGELWSIPIMLRLALIENIRRVSARIAVDTVDRNLADYWAEKMIDTAEKTPKELILVLADMARSNPPIKSAFVSELIRQLRGKGPDLALALNWIEQQLSGSGLTGTELVNAEIQKQAADQVSISNSIGSLRLLGAMDWRTFIESHSIVEKILLQDHDGIYGLMDFATRDRYRHVVESISKKSELSEEEVARIAIQLMHENTLPLSSDQSATHVGYYLIGQGLAQTKKTAKMHVSGIRKMQDSIKRHAFPFYLFFILLITTSIAVAIFIKIHTETENTWLLLLVSVLALLSASQLAISVVNFFTTLVVKPNLLPRMDYSVKIPPSSSTMVVIPSMLTTVNEIEKLVEALEVRFLANRKDHLHFGLLTDFTDASHEKLSDDQILLDTVKNGIEALNKKYQRGNNDLFFLFHRPRKWNLQENVWMGYERKRGKLSDLNTLLRGVSKEHFSLIIGNQSIFPKIRYVITLDADTQLPLNTAWKLIGTMAHPLNRAWYDEKKKRVTKGYGILQPRITVSLPDITGSRYTRMHGNEPGIDPYTRASSDVYQDLFGEGSYIGKGIYDVDMFQKVLDGRFMENRILSHDLLEGCYIRSGLLSDVQLFEKYPTTYSVDMKIRTRWLRGDWQIISWVLPWVTSSDKHLHKNPISVLSRWKIFDNMRRSLVPIALTVLLLLAWIVLPSVLFWTITISGIIVFPIIITSLWDILRKPKDVLFRYHVKNSFQNLREVTVKTLFTLICLPYEAFVNLRAIMRTLWRMFISGKKLLEWNPSSHAEQVDQSGLRASYATMWIEPVLAIAVLTILAIYAPQKLIVAEPIVLLWFIAPVITWFTSKPIKKQVATLTQDQHIFLQKLARKTWGFFEHFVIAEDNWLPPDNFQEQPIEQIAHRTSPTNIGLALLANLTACNFGYITTSQFIERTRNTINTMEKMERHNGHFYNWYDTETLNPLQPKYISTVDSGNLAGHLLVLRQGLLTLPHKKIISIKLFEGLRDTFRVLADTMDESNIKMPEQLAVDLDTICNAEVTALYEIQKLHEDLTKKLNLIVEKLNGDPNSETSRWKRLLIAQLEQVNQHFLIFAPWFLLQSAPLAFKYIANPDVNISWNELLEKAKELQAELNVKQKENNTSDEDHWVEIMQTALTNSINHSNELITASEKLAQQCNELADMEWDFLYDKSSHLFTIGYNVQEHHIDASYYDLLASEVRLCVFVCIAQGKLPEESWFALGRLLTNVDGSSILLSWSGSMFEYLMPLLVMPTFENTLLDQSNKAAVEWQIKYGKKIGRPWGISESGYNMINASSNYQYRAFGVPGLGLKRGLEEDTVIAPYASALALMVAPEKACKNLELLNKKGIEGKFGFYEAIDYTPSRLQRGQSSAIVYSFMAHHHGMSLLSLAYLLQDKPMQKLFELEPRFKASLLLLQERIPKASSFFAHTTDIADVNYVASGQKIRIINTPDTSIPEVSLLSNGRYHVMLTNAGGGYSRWKDLAVTRWHDDVTCDNRGTFCYIHDLEEETYWSIAHQPTLKKADKYEVAYSQGRVDFHITKNEIDVHTEIVVSPEDDIEMRRLHLTNCSDIRKTLELTSYAEVVLASAASDLIAPAFSNLFVQTEIIPHQNTILCTRRPRSAEEKPPWMFHLMAKEGKAAEEISYETDRMAFIGHGNSIVNPQVMKQGKLSDSQGSVLDPIVAIRLRITLEPEETITIDVVTGIAETKEICQGLINKYYDNKFHKDRVFEMAWSHSQVVLRQINASEADAQLYGSLASSILFANASFRADPAILINNHQQQSGLWGYAISGDLPIVLLKVESQENIQMVKQMIQAHAYWRLKGLVLDLVIWNETHDGYRQAFQNDIQALIPAEFNGKKGGIFIRASDQISNEDRILFQTVARIIISDSNGTLADHVNKKELAKVPIPFINKSETYPRSVTSIPQPEGLIFFNGLGGFSPDGKEYVIISDNKNKTPAPWVNVIANPNFGTVISESGSAYSWTENAHELRLTSWSNDPVSDTSGEAFYIRDEDSGHFWSTSLLPAGGMSPYITRHGFGYSVFEHLEDGIYTKMTVYVDIVSAIKFTVLKIRNQSGRSRNLSATGYIEWVLGDSRTKTAMHIHTEIDLESGALFANNQYNTEFNNRVAFFDVDYLKKTFTGDRTEFIGRNGNLQNPDALSRLKLSGKIGLALDPCAAIQVPFFVADGEEQEIIFRLGAGKDSNEASSIAKQFRGKEMATDALEKVKKYWEHTIGALQVETPDAAINIITNGWLTYQTLSSRLWGRSGFYQSGGAFGFRDQLQDVMSLLHIRPELAREQILLSASRQFKKGDVQHWWHPPIGRGVRTRISDDYLWLPFVTAYYIKHTGDIAVLDVSIDFLEGRLLTPEEESYYDLPLIAHTPATLYDHCVRAIKHGLNFGEHRLPLIGTGDWNDGFDKVGHHGKGESVWLAFFLYEILNSFGETARLHKDMTFANSCKKEANKLKANIDKNAWDGEWYKRAWFDDGTPLGSKTDEECKIDSIAQSWSVLSGGGNESLIHIAMESAYKNLVQKEVGLIKLLEPAFDKSDLNPGYIKGYVPGVRENGGQYTHAAVWMIMAFAKLGNNERVWELLKMINPISHGKTAEEIAIYKVEPYVLAADVYSRKPHVGRGGWTWYTGSAGWLYRLITQSFLGLQQEGNKLKCIPCIPNEWESFKAHYRYKNTVYHIEVRRIPAGEKMTVTVDGVEQEENLITLLDDNAEHNVLVTDNKNI